MKKAGIILIIAAFFLVIGLAVFLIVYGQDNFTGERIKNPDSYTLEIRHMNGTDRHTMELSAGDVLQVRFKTENGYLNVGIESPDGTALYEGNGRETTDFEINIPESGTYSINVKAHHAKGILNIKLKENSK